MRIVQITPGSGDSFYCENCLRDQALVRAMRAAGHDVLMVPMYLPPTTDGLAGPEPSPIFFGGLNVYLQQKSALFRRTPRWIDRLLDARWLLGLAGRRAGMTSARDLGETTLSVLRGEDGRQIKELHRLTDWLGEQGKPDVICLSNALLAGLIRSLKARLGGRVVCLLQDEDEFLDSLEGPDRQAAWGVLAERAAEADALVATSRYYADFMRGRLGIAPDKLQVVYSGVAVDDYSPEQRPPDRPTIGFLSRMCHRKGLDILVEALAILKQDPAFRDVALRVAGGKTAADDAYLDGIRGSLGRRGLTGDVEFLANLPFHQRVGFLRTLSVLSVPERVGEAGGRYILETLACGVPVVQPANGISVELLAQTGGGVLYEPNDPRHLAEALRNVLTDTNLRRELGAAGRQAVVQRFDVKRTAAELLDVFQKVQAPAKKERDCTD
jgi:glycosyltransferase involved in cell wall biosynthesis